MRLKPFSLLILFLCSSAFLFAGGEKETVELEVKIFHCNG